MEKLLFVEFASTPPDVALARVQSDILANEELTRQDSDLLAQITDEKLAQLWEDSEARKRYLAENSNPAICRCNEPGKKYLALKSERERLRCEIDGTRSYLETLRRREEILVAFLEKSLERTYG